MAQISVDSTSSGFNGSASSLSVSHTVATGATILIVAVRTFNQTKTCSGVTYNGVAMTQLATVLGGNNDRNLYYFYLKNPPAGTANIVASVTASSNVAVLGASYFNSKINTFPSGSSTKGKTTATSGSISTAVGPKDAWIISVFENDAAPTVAGSGTTVRVVNASADSFVLADSNGPVAIGTGTLNFTWGGVSANYAGIIAVLEPDVATLGEYLGAGSGTTKLLLHLNGSNADSSGNGNTGTDTSVTYSQSNGKLGQGAGFNGSSSKIAIASNLGIDGGNITISGWTKFTTLTGRRCELASQLSATSKVGYYIETAVNEINFYRVRKGIAADGYKYTVSQSPGTWYHYALTYDGTNVRGYVNGSLVGTAASSGNGSSVVTSGTYIGAEDGVSNFMNGSIDEVIIENVAWSSEKIKKYYTYTKGRFGII